MKWSKFLCYNENMMITPTSIIRSRRHSIALMVNSQGELVVRAPYYVSKIDIMGFVAQKQAWLAKQKALVEQELRNFQPLVLEENKNITILDKTYYIAKRGVDTIVPFGDALLVPFACTKKELLAWLKEQLWSVIEERLPYYAQVMGVKPIAVRISAAKSKWGSCNYKNALQFSGNLVFCPKQVIDYVIVHELAHINNKSHDKFFWQQVESVLPNYREQENWLKTHRKVMEII